MNADIGDNNPPSDEQAFLSELESRSGPLIERRDELLASAKRAPETIEDAATAGVLADFIKQLTAHEKTAETTRTDEKAPYFERGKWVDGFFKTTAVAGIAAVKATAIARLTAYQKKVAEQERLRREEEERQRREEAERARREAEERAQAAETEDDLDVAVLAEEEAAEATARAEKAERAAQAGTADLSRQHSSAGTVASLRSSWQCTVWSRNGLDLDALRDHFAEADIQKAIRSFVRAGGRELSGATIEEVSTSRVS